MIEELKQILAAANNAPSGDNCQPWGVKIGNSGMEFYNLPEKDRSLYNFGQLASFVAHGAFMENVKIAASGFGLSCQITPFPDRENQGLTATLNFIPDVSAQQDPLLPWIKKRTTNRKPFKQQPLTPGEKAALVGAGPDIAGSRLVLADGVNLKILANALSENESVVLENKDLHKFLFQHIRWNANEAETSRDGMNIKTMEMKPPQTAVFKLCSHWPIMRALNKLGMSRLVAGENAKTYEQSAAFGAVIVGGNKPENFLATGRKLERIWLTAASMGLSLQPLMGIALLHQKILHNDTKEFSAGHILRIEKAYKSAFEIFQAAGQTIGFLFRIGKSGPPSALSLKYPLEKFLIPNS